jgi:hypothetical protein
MTLTDTKLRTLEAQPRAYQVADADGLFVEVTPALPPVDIHGSLMGASGVNCRPSTNL